MPLIIHDARILSLEGDAPRRGRALGDVGVIPRGHVVVEGGLIAAMGEGDAPDLPGDRIDARGRVLLPGFVDAHSHACWAGQRLDEWDRRRAGASYLEILAAGGGIMSTVRAVGAASEDELTDLLVGRLAVMLHEGTTSVEVKSGYGLSPPGELKMLRAIRRAGERSPVSVIPTACLGHAIDASHPGRRDGFVRETIEVTLPAVHAEFPGIAVDAYCEDGAWSLQDCVRLFEAAASLGHPVRIHADQFHESGMTRWAVAHGARSVDHLEATSSDVLAELASSGTFGVMLPASGFHADDRYADGRAFVDAGGALVVATNFNPGTAPCASMPMAIALAVRKLGLTPCEAIAATTANAAALLGMRDRGRIEVGLRADLVLLRHRDERELAFEFGARAADVVVCGGVIVS